MLKRILTVFGLWVLLFGGCSCQHSFVGVFEVLPRNDIDKKLGQHFNAYGYRYTGGHYENELIPFRLYVPPLKEQTGVLFLPGVPPFNIPRPIYSPKTNVPLFVFFHGRGNYGDNYHQLRCLKSVDYDGTFFLLAASCNEYHPYWGTVETDIDKRAECPAHVTLEIIENLCKTFPIDRNEIHLIGYSDGTNAVSYMIDNGLRPKSAVYIGNEPAKESSVYFDEEGHYIRNETKLYFFYGSKDPTFPLGTIEPFAKKVIRGGGEIVIKKLDKPYDGHDSYKYVLGEYKLIQKLSIRNNKN
jgi:predicted esterase